MPEAPKGVPVRASHEQAVAVQSGACRPFLTAPCVADLTGRLRPVDGIRQCPFAAGADPCRLWRHSERERKTGPRPTVHVYRCLTHDRFFTVYPVGFTPYARERFAPVEADGEPALNAASGGVEPWRGTFFRGGACGSQESAVAA